MTKQNIGFGLAPLKIEGASIPLDSAEPDISPSEFTHYYYERAFTKEEYRRMAVGMEQATEPLVVEMREEFFRRAIHGDDLGSL